MSRPDFSGYGFALRKAEVGPHQIANVEPNSPALISGLKNDDYLIKINDSRVVGERYSKTITLIRSEAEKGNLVLEVVEPEFCPKELKEAKISLPPGYNTISSSKLVPIGTKTNATISNTIVQDLQTNPNASISKQKGSPGIAKRPMSVSPPIEIERNESFIKQQQRPFSMSDLTTIDPKSTVKSTKSFGSTLTGLSGNGESKPLNLVSRIVPTLLFSSRYEHKSKYGPVNAKPSAEEQKCAEIQAHHNQRLAKLPRLRLHHQLTNKAKVHDIRRGRKLTG